MRKFNTQDIFGALRLVKALGIKEELKNIALKMEGEKQETVKETLQKEVGAELVFTILDRAVEKNVESMIYEWLSGPLETQPETIKEMPAMDLIDTLHDFKNVEDSEGWKSFFGRVAGLMK